MSMLDTLQPFLNMITPTIGEKAVTKVIELFLNNNELIVNVPTWNLKNNFFVLKLELQTDRAPMTINDIFIESPDSTIIYPSQLSFSVLNQGFGNTKNLLIDPSSKSNYLKDFQDYFGGIINLNFDSTNKISIIFSEIHENINFDNWKINFKINKKLKTYNLKDLIIETPPILLYFKQRGQDIEKEVNQICEILGI